MRKSLFFILAIAMASVLASCSRGKVKYRIGVSQCSADIWRDKQNAELRMSAYFHDNVELKFAAAYDSDDRQIQQIDSLVSSGIDLLIVAPNQVSTISPAIDRAYDKGIPVIVFERKTSSQKYTAFISADNYEMGRVIGEYIATRLHGKGRVLEVMGLKGSSPAIDRHNGFVNALKNHPGIELVATLQGDWTEESAVKAIKDYKGDISNIDFVFGQNDRMAMGARKVMASASTKYCGIDGLPGENGGIRLVRDSILDATFIYPTHGDRLMQMAVDILEGKPYEKEVRLMSALVTKDNANVLLMQNEEIIQQSAYLDQLHSRADIYLQQLDTQRVITLMAIALIVLLILVATILYRYQIQKLRLTEERTKMEREQLDFYTQAAHELRTPLTLIEEPLNQLAETPAIQLADGKTTELFSIVRRNTANLSKLINKILDVQTGVSPHHLTSDQTDEIPIPQVKEESSKDTSAPATSEGETPTLLIVDDNADIRTLLKTILQPHYQLLEASDGQEGLRVAHEQVPDLIVSDVMMPVMNGLEFCQQIKTDFVTSHIPVILLTARALNKHQIEGYESGADAYITKPFQADLLLARISNLLKSRLQLRHLWSHSEQKEEKVEEEPKAEVKENAFILRFKAIVEEKMTDSNLSVEDIGAEMNLSRVQLYRKVKALTGCSPVDLLRKARLSEAFRLLSESDLSVSEIAYRVGFTSPSYFSKCFKEEFGKVPGETRK